MIKILNIRRISEIIYQNVKYDIISVIIFQFIEKILMYYS